MVGIGHLNFYIDILRYHESLPCRQHPFAYSTIVEAERVAKIELIDVQHHYGAAAGYVILDEAGFEITSGGGLPSHT